MEVIFHLALSRSPAEGGLEGRSAHTSPDCPKV